MVYVALGMTLIKILFDLVVFAIKKINQHKKIMSTSPGVDCSHQSKNDGINVCTNPVYSRKMKDGFCPRTKCNGFTTKESYDVAIINSPAMLITLKIVNMFPEFAAALLALNEIINAC